MATLGNTWGYAHEDWQPDHDTDERLRAPIIERSDADTLAWLYKSVAPAMGRLLKKGALDLDDFMEQVAKKAEGYRL